MQSDESPPEWVEAVQSVVAVRLCAPGQRPTYVQDDMARDIALAATGREAEAEQVRRAGDG